MAHGKHGLPVVTNTEWAAAHSNEDGKRGWVGPVLVSV